MSVGNAGDLFHMPSRAMLVKTATGLFEHLFVTAVRDNDMAPDLESDYSKPGASQEECSHTTTSPQVHLQQAVWSA